MMRVMRNHRLAAYDADEYENLSLKPQGLKLNIVLIIY
jgi:ribonucleoside-diphosphate reductase alpha chain